MQQITLFDDLPSGCFVHQRKKACKKRFSSPQGVQLSFSLTTRTELVDDQDDPWIHQPIIQRTVSAAQAQPIATKGPASVWDLAFTQVKVKQAPQAQVKKILKVERVNGMTRCTQVLEQDTEEWKAREVARRAKQRPPKPTAAFKTMSTKFKALIS